MRIPAWLESRLLPDSRFARAYAQFGDAERALLKRVIASHYLLSPPALARRSELAVTLPTALRVHTTLAPVDFVLLLVDESFDAPGLLLSALVPALTSGVPEVVVVRLGSSASIPHSILTACELAGQERFASLGPKQTERLLLDCLSGSAAGVLLYSATPDVLRVLDRPGLRRRVHCEALRTLALAPPKRVALWRDAPEQFPAHTLRLLYGNLCFELGGCDSGCDLDWQTFASHARDLLLVPEGRAEHFCNAQVAVSESQLGLWKWSRLTPDLFSQSVSTFSAAL
jgi:hypothetical protein